MGKLGVMLDCSRDGVYTVGALKKYIDVLSAMGYDSLQLYTEDVYEIEGEPYFGYLRGRYSGEELKELDKYAAGRGIELIPCIQTLAHLGGLTRWAEYADCTDCNDILLADEEKTYVLIEKMFRSVAENFTSRRINIGMDEAHMVGLGKYLDIHGYTDRFGILRRHLLRVSEIAAKYGFRPMMWSDMFFRLACKGEYYSTELEITPEMAALVPENVDLVYWDYYSSEQKVYDGMIRSHKKFGRHVVFGGGAWSWAGFAPKNTLSLQNSLPAIRSCIENGIDDIFITAWRDDGAECSLYGNLPALFAIAEYVRSNFDEKKIAAKFYQTFGVRFEDFMYADEIDLCMDREILTSTLCKYMLYSDPFVGFCDYTAKCGQGKTFAAVSEKLRKISKGQEYGYLFETLSALASVLELKYDLGIRTREAYRLGRDAVKELLPVYAQTEKRVKKFYALFRAQWDRECKPNGFEKHDLRLGGLLLRLAHCREILTEYAEGRSDRISVLEEKILPFPERGAKEGSPICYNSWHMTSMVKPF